MMSNHLHCGGCDRPCGAGEVCDAGACGPTCRAGLSVCDGGCYDLAHDPTRCGSCEIDCGERDNATSVCYAEGGGSPECGIVCAPDYRDCDGLIENGCEVHVNRFEDDMNNCGGCGIRCDDTLVETGEMVFYPAEACVGGRCWGDRWGRLDCEETGGELVVMQGCRARYGDSTEIVSTCCPFEEYCEASDMQPRLACDCGGPNVCLGWDYESWASGCLPYQEGVYLWCGDGD